MRPDNLVHKLRFLTNQTRVWVCQRSRVATDNSSRHHADTEKPGKLSAPPGSSSRITTAIEQEADLVRVPTNEHDRFSGA
jgi:hypothetical protein